MDVHHVGQDVDGAVPAVEQTLGGLLDLGLGAAAARVDADQGGRENGRCKEKYWCLKRENLGYLIIWFAIMRTY